MKYTNQTPFEAAKANNQRLTCTVAGCHAQRFKLHPWCRPHTAKGMLYGHPLQKPLLLSGRQYAIDEAAVLIRMNQSHPGLRQAVDYVEGWMQKAVANPLGHHRAYKGAEEINRLWRQGVTASDIVQAMVATYTFLQHNPRLVIDQRAYDYALSRAVFELAPRLRKVAPGGCEYSKPALPSALGYVGQHLREVLALFLANSFMAISDREARKVQVIEALKAPLRSDISELMEEAARAANPKRRIGLPKVVASADAGILEQHPAHRSQVPALGAAKLTLPFTVPSSGANA